MAKLRPSIIHECVFERQSWKGVRFERGVWEAPLEGNECDFSGMFGMEGREGIGPLYISIRDMSDMGND